MARRPQHSADDRLRFAMVTTFYPPYHFGGDAHCVRLLAHALARRGHQVDVIHDVDAYRMLRPGDEPEPLAEPPGVRVHPLRSRLGTVSCLATQQLGRPVVHGRKIRDILAAGFDVVHFHNISLVGGPAVLAYGDGIKLYTAHEHWLVCPSHILWRHKRELCTGRECLRCVLRHHRPPQLWRYTKLLDRYCRHVDAFCAPSEFCAEKHREFGFGFPMHVLPNFLPDEGTANPESNRPPKADRPFFLFVGRLERIKGLQDVIPIFAARQDAELWVAGKGDNEPQLRALAGDSRSIRFLGTQTPEQLRPLYREARAVMLPSICYEVLPMVALESFREATPIIARRLGPFPEIIAQSNGGLLFETPADLAGHVSRLTGDDELRATLGAAGREEYERRWSETAVLSRYFELIGSLASKRRLDHIVDKVSAARKA